MILNIFKPLGMTPLDAINAFREQNSKYKDVKLGYAGRLDPLAEGVLLVLGGEDLNRVEEYRNFDKTYKAKILLGFETDTYDALGIAKKAVHRLDHNINEGQIRKYVSSLVGEYIFQLPAFSSIQIKGHPLFWWARNNRLHEIEIPKRTTKIYQTEFLGMKKIKSDDLLNQVTKSVNLVKGDFRQKEIIDQWNLLLKGQDEQYQVLEVEIKCSSGTYIRSIAYDLGRKLETSAMLLNLIRIQVGEYCLEKSELIENNPHKLMYGLQ